MTSKKNKYNELAFRANNIICCYRLVVRTSGFHPGNRSSILRSSAIIKFSKRLRIEKPKSKSISSSSLFLSRSREVASRKAHNLEVVGSIPASATKKITAYVSVAQLVRARDSYPRGRWFNSTHWYHIKIV